MPIQVGSPSTAISAPQLAQLQADLNLAVYIGTWAGRPAANAVPVGSKMRVTNFGLGGQSEWWSDGTIWRPVNGQIVCWLYGEGTHGGASSGDGGGVASLTGNGAAQKFTLPGTAPEFPAGMLQVGMQIEIGWLVRKFGTHTGSVNVVLSPSDTMPAVNVYAMSTNATAGSVHRGVVITSIGSTKYLGSAEASMAVYTTIAANVSLSERTNVTLPNTGGVFPGIGIGSTYTDSEARLLQAHFILRG